MKMYKLQWAYMMNEDGSRINPEDMNYHDTVYTYEDRNDAEQDRLHFLQNQKNDNSFKYVRVVECE